MSLIAITQRFIGEQITAAKYNADRQQIVDGLAPATIEDYSVNEAQMQLVTDPGEPGSPNLAGTLAGEHERERFILKEMKGTPHWYTTNTTRHIQVSAMTQTIFAATWNPTGTTTFNFFLMIPDGWSTNSNFTLKLFRRSTSATGTSKMNWLFTRIRDGAAPNVSGSAAIDFTPADTNSHLVNLTVTVSTTFQAGDACLITVNRTGDDAADNNPGVVVPDAYFIEFTGIASR